MKTNPDGTEENEVKISGELTRIIFKNDNGFLIGAFTGEEQFTATGTLINPQTGLDYALHGDWKDTPKYGRQFVLPGLRRTCPLIQTGSSNISLGYAGSSGALWDKESLTNTGPKLWTS